MEDTETYQELLNAAERLKKTLSNRKSVVEPVRFMGKRSKVELTRETFDEISRTNMERTLTLTEQELEKARQKGFNKIDKLLLVGGSTYMPQILETVKDRFGIEVLQFDPNQAVAKGAAIFGFKCMLDEQIKVKVAEQTGQNEEEVDLTIGGKVIEAAQEAIAEEHGLTLPGLQKLVEKTIVNVSSKSFGIKAIDPSKGKEVVANMIYVDDRVPSSVTQKFGTHAEGQVQADLVCLEGLAPQGKKIADLEECQEIGKALLDFGKPMPQNSPVEISFEMGPDGLLTVNGRDLSNGATVKAEFKTEAIMGKEEVEAARDRNLAIAVS